MYVLRPYYDSTLCIPPTSSKMYHLPCYYDAFEFCSISRLDSNKQVEIPPKMVNESEGTKRPTEPIVQVHSHCTNLSSEEAALAERQKKLLDRLAVIRKQLDKQQAKIRGRSLEVAPKLLVARKDKKFNPKSFDYASFNNSSALELLTRTGQCLHVSLTVPKKRPPFSLFILLRLLTQRSPIVSTLFHVHSSLHSEMSDQLLTMMNNLLTTSNDRGVEEMKLALHILCTPTEVTSMKLTSEQPVLSGEKFVAEYVAKLANLVPMGAADTSDSVITCNSWCERIWQWIESNEDGTGGDLMAILKDAEVQLAKSSFLCGSAATLADVCLWSALCRLAVEPDQCKALTKVQRWCQSCGEDPCFRGVADLAESCYKYAVGPN